jgi:hypothetical protein
MTATSLLVGNGLVFLLLCSIVILCGECYYRFVFDTTDSFGLTKTTERWFARHFQRNNVGFRDNEPYTLSRQPGKRRVTFLGDSFTAAHGVPNVEDRFANRIRTRNPHLEVQTIAQCGWDTGAEAATFDSILQRGYACDVVVLVYCLNDVSDILPEWPAILKRVYGEDKPVYLVRHSFLFNTYYYRYKAARDPDISDYYNFTRAGYDGAVWEQQKLRLKSIRDQVEVAGGKLFVVTFPFLHALDDYDEYAEIHERLGDHWSELDVPHLDLLNTYRSLSPSELVVNSHDAHPNERAHELAAAAIDKFLVDSGVE